MAGAGWLPMLERREEDRVLVLGRRARAGCGCASERPRVIFPAGHAACRRWRVVPHKGGPFGGPRE